MKVVVAAFNKEKVLVGAFSVITNLRMDIFEALAHSHQPISQSSLEIISFSVACPCQASSGSGQPAPDWTLLLGTFSQTFNNEIKYKLPISAQITDVFITCYDMIQSTVVDYFCCKCVKNGLLKLKWRIKGSPDVVMLIFFFDLKYIQIPFELFKIN